MKTNYYSLLVLLALLGYVANAQTGSPGTIERSGATFHEEDLKKLFLQNHSNLQNFGEFRQSKMKEFLESQNTEQKLPYSPPSVNATCTNMDFEQGNLNGWTTSNGYHPLYNAAGCCTFAGGQQQVVSGNGIDPCGGFPTVSPGGNFSLMLGDNQTGGLADRIEQTFTVGANNVNYTYKYAVVLQDAGLSHAPAEQPRFTIDMVDANGNVIPCTQYDVMGGQGIPGFQNSATCPQAIFKPWTFVSVNLTNYVNQNVTIRFTTYDCAFGGHYAYAYIDGTCLTYQAQLMDTLCVGGTATLCAPPGFATYNWSGPGVNGQTGQCVSVSSPANYQCNIVTLTGCPGPIISYNVNQYPTPVAGFTIPGNNQFQCNPNVYFNNTTSNPSGTNSYQWYFGDGDSSQIESPTHNYASTGVFTITLIATTSVGCSDTTTQTIIIQPPPTPVIVSNGICAGSPTTFSISGVNTNNIVSTQWQIGSGWFSSTLSPVYSFGQPGTYTINLTVTDVNGCNAAATHTLNISPKPISAFNAAPVCDGNNTQFNNQSAIASGSINSYDWDFNNDGLTDATVANPSYLFTGSGNYPVRLIAVSNNFCSDTVVQPALVHATPIVNFAAPGVCEGFNTQFINYSTVAAPSTIASTVWNFGNGSSSTQFSPAYNYTVSGVYQTLLSVTSNNGCTAAFTQTVAVYPKPIINFTANGVCENQQTQFVNNSTIASGTISSWAWDFNQDGNIDNYQQNPSYTFPFSNIHTVNLTATSQYGCVSIGTQTVMVYANPVAKFFAQSNCLGDPSAFIDQSNAMGSTISSWQWDFTSDGNIDNISQNPSNSYATTGNFLVTLIVQTPQGCIGQIQKNIRIHPKPQVSFVSGTQNGCPTLCVNFFNQSVISSGTISQWIWNFGDNSLPASNQNPQHCFESGTYQVSLTAVSDSGCSASYFAPGIITVYPEPIADFQVLQETGDVLDPKTDIQDNSSGASTWTYLISDGHVIQNAQNFTYYFNQENPQMYYVTQIVTNTYGCVDTITKPVEIKPAYTFYIPNAFTPNGDGNNDQFRGEGIGINEFKMWIFDRWGNQVFYSDSMDKSWDGTFKSDDGEKVLQDVYVWKVQLKDVFEKKHELKGTVTVVR